MKTATFWIFAAALTALPLVILGQGRGAQSPASQRPPETVNPQSYSEQDIKAGENRFASQCGFCHGRDAAGGETGPDLTRSMVVAEDLRGDKLGPLIRSGRQDKGMPAFDMGADDIRVIVAFIHDQKTKAESLGGGRRSVDVADLQTGNVDAGRRYFSSNCSSCHSATGDLAGIATRFQGLPLLQRMLYPTSGRPAPAPAKVTVQLRTGESITGSLVSRDEFSVVLTDGAGVRRAFASEAVQFKVDDPLETHFELLGKYTDSDMHDVFAYLQTLK